MFHTYSSISLSKKTSTKELSLENLNDFAKKIRSLPKIGWIIGLKCPPLSSIQNT